MFVTTNLNYIHKENVSLVHLLLNCKDIVQTPWVNWGQAIMSSTVLSLSLINVACCSTHTHLHTHTHYNHGDHVHINQVIYTDILIKNKKQQTQVKRERGN